MGLQLCLWRQDDEMKRREISTLPSILHFLNRDKGTSLNGRLVLGQPRWIAGILQVDANDLILWEKRGEKLLVYCVPPPRLLATGFKKLR